jgi:hypothetical protein
MTKCKLEQFSRVTGFYSTFHAYNPGKKSEFLDRKKFDKAIKVVVKNTSNDV